MVTRSPQRGLDLCVGDRNQAGFGWVPDLNGSDGILTETDGVRASRAMAHGSVDLGSGGEEQIATEMGK
uniref:Uncharacterized protein n=1 Tax=Arundo donax TaxID=35708 RepID=A0A0A9E4S8_ARUDO